MISFPALCSHLGIEKNKLKEALTHYSFYLKKGESKGNGRLVYAGMYIFRGQLAEIIFSYFAGTGTQLQHITGNLLKTEYLNQLFDKWTLKKFVRSGDGFDINSHKQVFVNAVLGCVSQLEQENRQNFIFKFIICKETDHIFKHLKRNKNLIHQVNFIANKMMGKKLTTIMEISAEGMHRAIVQVDADTLLAKAESKSYKYARKKAMKSALQTLSGLNMDRYINESDYLERIRKREEDKREKRRLEIKNRQDLKEQYKKEKAEKLRLIKKARDLERKRSQAEAKKRKAEREAMLAARAAKEQRPISANKRRHLEDKKR